MVENNPLGQALDYIGKMSKFFIDNPDWVKLAEEARQWIGEIHPLTQISPTRYEIVYGRHHSDRVCIESRGDDLWAIVRLGLVLNQDGEEEYEPLPSNRSDEFIARTRFTLFEAVPRALAHAESLRKVHDEFYERAKGIKHA
jgi:hypothetical protein